MNRIEKTLIAFAIIMQLTKMVTFATILYIHNQNINNVPTNGTPATNQICNIENPCNGFTVEV